MATHHFAERLRQLRRERGLLQRELEDALSLRPGALSQYECGRREPGFDLLVGLADYLNVSLDYLLGRVDAQQDSPAVVAGRARLREFLAKGDMSMPQRAEERVAHIFRLADRLVPDAFTISRMARYLRVPESVLQGFLRGELTLPSKVISQALQYLAVPEELASEQTQIIHNAK